MPGKVSEEELKETQNLIPTGVLLGFNYKGSISNESHK